MKRRKFIFIAVGATAALSISALYYRRRHTISGSPLVRPAILSRFCDEKEIYEIGKHYRSCVPAEGQKEKLKQLLLTNEYGKKIASSDDPAISEWIEEKVSNDFESGKIVMIDGWVLSVTEARQCALLSITTKQ